MESYLTMDWYEVHEFRNNDWHFCSRQKSLAEAEEYANLKIRRVRGIKLRIVKVVKTLSTKMYTYETIE